MVSTRQMAITTGPCAGDDGFQTTTTTPHSRSGQATASSSTSSHHHGNGSMGTALSRRPVSPNAAVCCETTANTAGGAASTLTSGVLATSNVSHIGLLDLPIELLDSIFSYVGYKKVAQMRTVSQTMNAVCSSILNSTFQKLQTQMHNRFQAVKAKMPRRESARRNHPLASECDILETCSMRLQLLQMTFGKHIERNHCCFFPGAILDEVYSVLNYIRTTPTLARPYKVTDELFDLSTMAMEYFKEQLEPNLPDIYFNKDLYDFPVVNSPSYMADPPTLRESSSSPPPPQSNMVLRKGIRKIKQGMKRYNNQLSLLRNELRTCKRKATEQAKQLGELQKSAAEQQKQTMENSTRLDENDKKNEEIARKFSTLLQELNKCRTELRYWRSKSPSTPICQTCGQIIIPVPSVDDIPALVYHQGIARPDNMAGLRAIVEHNDDDVVMAAAAGASAVVPIAPPQPQFALFDDQPLSPISINTTAPPPSTTSGPPSTTSGIVHVITNGNCVAATAVNVNAASASASASSSSPQKNAGTAAVCGHKRKAPSEDAGPSSASRNVQINGNGGGGGGGSSKSDNSNAKKIRRVQTKARSQLNVASSNAKTRSK